jgi:DNA-binding CsgD family transcriptional regulator
MLPRFHGRLLQRSGDTSVAAFDGPARAIRCAQAIHDAAHGRGLEVRSGLHTGECEVHGDSLRGVAIPVAGWVAGQAAPGEILVSSTVRDLVAGAGLNFADRGVRAIGAGNGEWRLFGVLPDRPIDLTPPHPPEAALATPAPILSRREQEVLPLVARGLSNRQIAAALCIGERTAESHVASILAKWQLSSRSQLAAAVGGNHGPLLG